MPDSYSLADSPLLQLQARYPHACLITELVQVHQQSYVVRGLVQLGNTTLVTAMSAAATVEQAEDQARLRVLTLLGIDAHAPARSASPTPTSPTPTSYEPASYEPLPPLPSTASGDRPYGMPSPPPGFTADAAATAPVSVNGAPRPLPPLPIPPGSGGEPAVTEPLLPEVPAASVKIAKQPSPKKPSEPPPLPDLPDLPDSSPLPEPVIDFESDQEEEGFLEPEGKSIGEPVDLSELIALTDVEMERIGWGKKRGQSHLKRTYGRQTRAELNEDQLLEFLHFLRALPSQLGGDSE